MQEMSAQLQQDIWQESCSLIRVATDKYPTIFDVILEGVDNQYLEIAFTCQTCDIEYSKFLSIIKEEFLTTIKNKWPSLKIQEFAYDKPFEVDFDRYDWQHVAQFSVE